MSDSIKIASDSMTNEVDLNAAEHPAWDEPVICRVEVDLPSWLAKLTGESHWEVYREDEEENCISFGMRAQPLLKKGHHTPAAEIESAMQAEVTLYHNGYAVVDVDGKSLFDGALTAGSNDYARLSYYHVSGEPIALN